jgi:hypothetical protein
MFFFQPHFDVSIIAFENGHSIFIKIDKLCN